MIFSRADVEAIVRRAHERKLANNPFADVPLGEAKGNLSVWREAQYAIHDFVSVASIGWSDDVWRTMWAQYLSGAAAWGSSGATARVSVGAWMDRVKVALLRPAAEPLKLKVARPTFCVRVRPHAQGATAKRQNHQTMVREWLSNVKCPTETREFMQRAERTACPACALEDDYFKPLRCHGAVRHESAACGCAAL